MRILYRSRKGDPLPGRLVSVDNLTKAWRSVRRNTGSQERRRFFPGTRLLALQVLEVSVPPQKPPLCVTMQSV